MIIIAITLYLPQHIAFLTNRAWFYYNGDEATKSVGETGVAAATTTILVEKVKETIANVGTGSSIFSHGKEL
jgi:hypothetical protein